MATYDMQAGSGPGMITATVEELFEGFSDLSGDDFEAINRATQLMNLRMDASDSGDDGLAENDQLRLDLQAVRFRAEGLERDLLRLQQDRMTKEGEVAILRDRLTRIEEEKSALLNKACDRLRESEDARHQMEEDHRKSVASLKTEVSFKTQELESLMIQMESLKLSSNGHAHEASAKKPKAAGGEGFIPDGFAEAAAVIPGKRNLPVLQSAAVSSRSVAAAARPARPPSDEPCYAFEQQLLDDALACVELEFSTYRTACLRLLASL